MHFFLALTAYPVSSLGNLQLPFLSKSEWKGYDTHVCIHIAPHVLFLFNRKRFPWQPSTSMSQCLLLSKSLMIAKNKTLPLWILLLCPPRAFLHMGRNGSCLVCHQPLISQCLATDLKTYLLNE